MRDAISKHVDTEDKGVAECDTLGGRQAVKVTGKGQQYFVNKFLGGKCNAHRF